MEPQITQAIAITIIRLLKPYELKGDTEAAAIVSAISAKPFSESGIKRRIQRGVYVDGVHFRDVGAKMRLWNREALIRAELAKESQSA